MDAEPNDEINTEGTAAAFQFGLRSLFVATAVIALVCGLIAWNVVGVLFIVIPNATAALIAVAVARDNRKAATASLFAFFCGWCVAFVALVVWQVHSSGFGYITDFELWLFWPALFALFGWGLFVLPVIAYGGASNILYRPIIAVLPWTGLAVAAYTVLVCTWAFDLWRIAWFPAIIGAVAGLVFPFLVKARCASYAFAAGPSVVLVCFWCFLWPSLEFLVPGFTYAYGTPNARARSLVRVFRAIKVGDSLTELQRRYPSIFHDSFSGMGTSGSTDQLEYHCEIRINEVTEKVEQVSCEVKDRH